MLRDLPRHCARSNDAIQEFASKKGASFPVTGKVNVTGDGTHPLWQWMSSQPSDSFGLASVLPGPQWNFHKVLLVDGAVSQHYAPTTAPESIAADIEKALKKLPLATKSTERS
jgi:glutathione peroxidase